MVIKLGLNGELTFPTLMFRKGRGKLMVYKGPLPVNRTHTLMSFVFALSPSIHPQLCYGFPVIISNWPMQCKVLKPHSKGVLRLDSLPPCKLWVKKNCYSISQVKMPTLKVDFRCQHLRWIWCETYWDENHCDINSTFFSLKTSIYWLWKYCVFRGSSLLMYWGWIYWLISDKTRVHSRLIEDL